ncbi:MAG TPA: alkaline phosphatase [Bacteroidetes bacterium]|nr:alkaline phosphatase [Bacteroidota bacterium]
MLLRIASLFLLAFWSLQCNAQAQSLPKNLILMIPDGFGPASLTMARDFQQATTGKMQLALDEFLVGNARTYASNSRVTDSAAGATAYSCGIKTYNGAIAVAPDGTPCATLFEAAKKRGLKTGVVVTTRITHATPAAFSSHVPRRANEDDIATQQIENSGMDLIFGGGGKYFIPKEAGGARADGRNLLLEAKRKGYALAGNLAEFHQLSKLPAIAVFAPDHMAYEVDRDPTKEPSLAEMTEKALQLLQKNNPKGFVLMVEGSRIDHAGHANDPAGHVHDILAYDAAVRKALEFARRDGQTLVVSVADHETGGMTLGRNGVYQWKPEALAKVKNSVDTLAALAKKPGADVVALLKEKTGITDLTEEEITTLKSEIAAAAPRFAFTLIHIVSKRSIIGWTTDGHSAVDVTVHAYGPGTYLFRGNHENAAVGQALAKAMRFDLKALTKTMFK